jgi:hypothetical protein
MPFTSLPFNVHFNYAIGKFKIFQPGYAALPVVGFEMNTSLSVFSYNFGLAIYNPPTIARNDFG